MNISTKWQQYREDTKENNRIKRDYLQNRKMKGASQKAE